MPILKHVHRYKRHRKNPNIYLCADPGCTHHVNDKELLVGKVSQCNKCGLEFILDRKQLKNRDPVCVMCSRSKKKDDLETAKSVMSEILSEAS